jgi:hypothetical protein
VTEPVPSATSPRRTVRVAVALVAGQAALCAVLGYLTFGAGPSTTSAPDRAAEARAPAVMPTASLAVPVAPMPPVPGTSASTRSTPQRKSRTVVGAKAEPSPRKKATRQAEEPPRTIIAPDDGADPAPQPTGPKPTGGATATPGDELSGPKKVGDPCDTEGLLGLTAEGKPVRCTRDDDGDLRWTTP